MLVLSDCLGSIFPKPPVLTEDLTMKTHSTLILSSIFASLITLAAAPAMAQTHLDYAADPVATARGSDFVWAMTLVWASAPEARTFSSWVN